MQINHYSEDYKRFEQDFNKLYTGIEPLFSIVGDLERAMTKDKPYFILPTQQSKDGRKHVFYFEILGDKYVYSHLT